MSLVHLIAALVGGVVFVLLVLYDLATERKGSRPEISSATLLERLSQVVDDEEPER